ncbi:hypothetical protein [Citricoccus sp. GCM10030269]|uniref:hypothetical protein n=1 Tax=Citricoccus sp. GCM10030269 TaxID=3273388 RepID=UPI003623C226
MRTPLSILLAALAGLLAALSFVAARADDLVHTPEPLQQIAGSMSQDQRLREAVPEELGRLVEEQLPDAGDSGGSWDGFAGLLQTGLVQLVQRSAEGLVTDERFPAAWSEVIEQTRTDWVARIDRLAEDLPTPADAAREAASWDAASPSESSPSESSPADDAATVHLQIAPLMDLGVDRLADAVSGVPGGESIAETLENGLADASEDSLTSVDLSVPDPDAVPRDAMVMTVDNLHRWPWLAGASAVLALVALLVAPRRRRGVPLVVLGMTILAVGVVCRWGLEEMAPAAGVDGIARAASASLLDGIRDYWMPDTAILLGCGGLALAMGAVTTMVSHRRRRAIS